MPKGYKAATMDKSKFIKWALQAKIMNRDDAEKECQFMLAKADDTEVDQDGPSDAPTRNVVKLEDFVVQQETQLKNLQLQL